MRTVDGDENATATTRSVERRAEAADAREAAVTLNVAGPGVAASIVRLTNAISIRLEDDLKASAASSSKTETAAAHKQQYEFFAAQISREDGLIHQRMSWTLQLNGFLFVALALMKISFPDEATNSQTVAPWLGDFLLGSLPLAGLGITVAGWLGLRAAIHQLNCLRSGYARDVQAFASENRWPRPFGDRRVFWDGSAAVQLALATLCFLWSWLVAHRVWPDAVEASSKLVLHVLARIFN